MCSHIFSRLCTVEMSKLALEVDALPDCCIGLHAQLVPKLALSNQYQSHRALRVHLEIEEKPHFLQHLTIQQMSLVNNDDRLQMLNTTHQFDFVMKLPFGIA